MNEYVPDSNGGRYLAKKRKEEDEDEEEEEEKEGIYYIASHGCDTGKSIEVPEGCTYCTEAVCGVSTKKDEVNTKIEDMFLKGDNIFRNPTDVNKLFKKHHFSIHTHLKNEKKAKYTYSKSFYTMSLLFFHCENLIRYLISRIKYINHVIQDTPSIKKLFNECTLTILPSGVMKLGHYSYQKDFKIEYEEPLFNSELYDTFITLLNDKLRTLQNRNENEIARCINDAISDLFNMNVNFKTGLPLKGQLGRMYSKSFFPTYNDVTKALTEHNIRNIYQAHKKIDEIFNISQRDLFHYFPGIYYNPACRDKCEFGNNSNIQLRRELSLNAFNKMNINTDNSYKHSYKRSKRSRSPKSSKSRSPRSPKSRSRSPRSHSKRTLKSLPRNRKRFH